MNRTLQLSSFLAIVSLAACAQTPTSPSRAAVQTDAGSVAPLSWWASASRSIVVADWSCLTQGVGCTGGVDTGRITRQSAGVEASPAEAPAAPANLSFQVTGNTIVLTWLAPASGAVDTYVLEAGTAAGSSNVIVFPTGGAATTFTATSVPAGTYFVRVRARNADGTSSASNEATVIVGAAGGSCPTPGAPTGFGVSASGNTLTLTWSAVSGALSYIIEAGSAPGAANIVTFDSGSAATSFVGNAPNGTYYLRVRARTACGTSTTSNEASIALGASAPAPGAGVTGRWVGLQANGDGATSTPNECGVERWDWQLDLVQNGASVSGTLTQTTVASGCDATGQVQALNFTGSVSGNTLTMTATPTPTHRLDITATVNGTRMTGTGLVNGGAFGTASFVANRQ
jgi:hypothetical protein